MKFKNAKAPSEILERLRSELGEGGTKKVDAKALEAETEKLAAELKKKDLLIEEWKVEDVGAELSRVGYEGSPTKVRNIEFVVIKGAETKMVEPTDEGLGELLRELVAEHTLG